jgi:diadenosine tetraphosphatase ApaH/serine/threonine PP2A family protein phosphatase
MLSNSRFNRIFVGHTHVQCQIPLKNRKMFCNPGSVGQPRDGNSHAAFAIITKEDIALHRVDYAKNIVYKKMSELGFDEYTYKNLELGTRIGGKIDNIVKVL